MIGTSAWEPPSRVAVIAVVGALLLTALGEGLTIRSGSASLALATIAWYGVAFCGLAWYRLPVALFGLVVTLPLITVEVGLGDVEKTLSTDKVALAAVVSVWLVRRLPTAWRLVRLSSVRWWDVFLVVVLLSALSNGLTISQAWGFLKQALYAGVFLMALDTLGSGRVFLRQLLTATAVAGILVAMLAAVEGISHRGGHPLALYFKHGTMMDMTVAGATISHVNFLGGYLLLILPTLVVVSFTAGGRIRALLIVGGVMVALTFLYAGSMGASIGLLTEGLLVVGLAAGGTLPRTAWRLSLGAFAATVLIAVAVIVPKSASQSVSLSTRLATYQIGVAAVGERPLLGFGANGYPNQFWRLERRIFGGERTELHEAGVPLSAHSSFVDVAVERGLVGLVAFAGLLMSILSVGIGAYFRSQDVGDRLLALGIVAGLAGFIVQAFTENLFSYSKVAAIFWILAAALVSLTREGEAGTG